MTEQERSTFIVDQLKRIEEVMDDADYLIGRGSWMSGVGRLYYACYYAVSALLVEMRIYSKTHQGVRRAFHNNFIRTGVFTDEVGKLYTDLFYTRMKADYGSYPEFEEEQVAALHLQVQEFIAEARGLLAGKLSPPDTPPTTP